MTTDLQGRAAAWQQRLGEGFDRQAIERLIALDPDESSGLMPRVLQAFEASLQAQLPPMETASARGDMQACRRAAHALRSGSNSLGALTLAQACHALEMQANALGDSAPSPQALQSLQQQAHQVAQLGHAFLRRVQLVLRDEQA